MECQESITSNLRYRDKVTIVTGASKGIGEGCVRVFVRNGAKVVFCANEAEEGQALESDVNKRGPGTARFLQCDLNNEIEIKNLVEETVKIFGGIDCLINNVAHHPPHTEIDDISSDDFRSLFNLNVMSYFLAAKYALPHLRQSKGNIINTSSLVGTIGQPGAVAYVATKGAITSMSKAMAIDGAKYGVRCNTFSPGNVWTPMWDQLSKNTHDPAAEIKRGEEAQLMGRMGTIEEAGLLCLYLAAEATFLTGADIPLTGGAELDYGKKTKINHS